MASLIENMAPEYTTDGAKAGNYYMHSKLLYLCKSDCSGLFDESNFEQVYLSDLLRGTANSNLGVELVLFQEVKLSAAGNSGNTNIKSENVDIPKGNYIIFGGRRNVGTDLSCSIGTKLQDTKNGNSLLMSTWIVNVDTTTSITLSANMIWGDDSAFQIIKIE